MRVLFDTTALYVAAGLSDVTFTPKVQRLLEHSETARMFPFDRMLIATALAEDISIVASDREFKRYKGLRVIW